MKTGSFFMLAVTAVLQIAHVSGHGLHERSMHPKEIARRQLQANRRHIAARNCAPQIAEFHRKRKLARRGLTKRQDASSTESAIEPHTTSITNLTCVTAPEVTEGPYYLNNDILRQDVRDGEAGILLSLDIGVIDTSTCEPLPSALVEIWHCNSTGFYSGFTSASLGSPPGGDEGSSAEPSDSTTFDLSSLTSFSALPTDSAVPTGGPGGGGGGGGSSKTDNLNFLRGGFETNENGIVAFNSIYPGFYTGRAVHIHTMVHQNVTYSSNGTFVSRSGSLVHIGQMFFDDTLNDEVMALDPYSTTTQSRMYNDEDSILAEENANGYNAFVDTELIGSDISEGVLGYITLTVDSTAEYEVTSFNYFEGEDGVLSSTASASTETGTEAKTETVTVTETVTAAEECSTDAAAASNERRSRFAMSARLRGAL